VPFSKQRFDLEISIPYGETKRYPGWYVYGGDRVIFTADILFIGGHPIAWAGPVSN